ncbi:hypothetical protein LEM8419_03579 [Neolewinella maritima]|uniref:Uncharacterized protein n=1 Tax=Neolewinella maritima TaxID=1383882 RepID=A0ABN8F700_9BACT|nr:hypothetical protein [Neolewinella maritima]CAH1002707.1 hypothetical protein LEM8419_03579 [Neolewinella maritima]
MNNEMINDTQATEKVSLWWYSLNIFVLGGWVFDDLGRLYAYLTEAETYSPRQIFIRVALIAVGLILAYWSYSLANKQYDND